MSKEILIIVAILAVAAPLTSGNHNAKPMVEHNLISTILRSSRTLGSPRSLECFAIYMPQLQDATEEYEKEYQVCLDKRDNSKQRVDKEVEQSRIEVGEAGSKICTAYSHCSKIVPSPEYFDCYNATASDAIKSSYEIQTVSKDKMLYIQLRFETIAFDYTTCTNTCENKYRTVTDEIYYQLNKCLGDL